MSTKNIMITGVGGQGTLLAVRILAHIVQEEGYDVKVSEVHGMSQRGGSVVTYLKYGDKVYSPIIGLGEADTVLSFEKLEALRCLPYLKEGGEIIVNDQEIDPMPVITGAMPYPENIEETLKAHAKVRLVKAGALALEAGNARTANVVLLGAMAAAGSIPKEKWISALKSTVPERFLEVNLKAFDLGYAAAQA